RRIVLSILVQIRVIAPEGIGKHLRPPADQTGDGFRIGVEQKLFLVEPVTGRRFEGTRDAVSVELALAHLRNKTMPDLIGALAQADADGFLRIVRSLKQAKFHPGGIFRKQGEIHPLRGDRRSERVRLSDPDSLPWY